MAGFADLARRGRYAEADRAAGGSAPAADPAATVRRPGEAAGQRRASPVQCRWPLSPSYPSPTPPPTLTEDAFRANPCRTGFLRNVSARSPGGTRQRCGRSLACPSSLPPRVTRCLGPWRARPRNRGGLKPARPGSTSRDLAGHTRCEMPHQASRCRKAPFASPGAPAW